MAALAVYLPANVKPLLDLSMNCHIHNSSRQHAFEDVCSAFLHALTITNWCVVLLETRTSFVKIRIFKIAPFGEET